MASGGGDPDAMLANGMTARQAVEARTLHMKDLGGSFKAVKDQLAGSSPNLAAIRQASEEVRVASDALQSWFPAGSGPETGLEMRAFSKVWADASGFSHAAQTFKAEAATLSELVKTEGNGFNVMENQVKEVARTCSECHDTYRAKKKD